MNMAIQPQPSAALFELELISLAVSEGMEIEHFDWEEAKNLVRANGADLALKEQLHDQAIIAEKYLAKIFQSRNQIYQIIDNCLLIS